MLKYAKNKDGFTLMELIIVLAIIAILSAIIIPNFIFVTDRAKFKSDIQSARTVQNAIDLYFADTGDDFNKKGSDAKDIIETLREFYYLSGDITLQTKNADWEFLNQRITINISNCEDNIKKLGENSTANEKPFISGVKFENEP